jgi:indole-3-glycerol phosphate synthase
MSLRQDGYEGFLIGESFMASQDPGKSATNFIKDVEA